jgi:transcriptional regulator with XRE-family HTH domain
MPLTTSLKDAVAALERGLGLSDATLASAIGVDPRSLGRWREGETFPQRAARGQLDDLLALVDRLSATFDNIDTARMWMRTDNRYLGHIKPAEALAAGRIDRVTAALDAFDAGLFI